MKSSTRDRRSQRTRDLISGALNRLMLEKHYDQITVQDIIERANVGRSTFYAHFQDKDALLATQLEQVLDHLGQAGLPGADPAALSQFVSGLFRHVQQNQRLMAAFRLGSGPDLPFRNAQALLYTTFEKYLAALPAGRGPAPPRPAPPLPLVANFLAGSLITMLRWWLDNNLPYPPERMAELFQQLALPGTWAALDYHS